MHPRGFTYRYHGTLTAPVKDIHAAQKYLTEDNMTQYLDICPSVVYIYWNLHSDGSTYDVTAVSMRLLTDEEIDQLTDWVKGQNSDGLGEGFEQQDFAEITVDAPDYWEDEDEDLPQYGEASTMASFDWQTNETKFALVVPQ